MVQSINFTSWFTNLLALCLIYSTLASPIEVNLDSNSYDNETSLQRRAPFASLSLELGSASTLVLFSVTTIRTSSGSSVIGDIGVARSGEIGFAEFGETISNGRVNPLSVTGTAFDQSHTGQIYADFTSAWSSAKSRTAPLANMNRQKGNLDKIGTLSAGIYKWESNVVLGNSQSLTLHGVCGEIFIFISTGSISCGEKSEIRLTGGLTAASIFWVSASSISTGVGSSFSGIILSGSNVVIAGKLSGSVFAHTEISLRVATVTRPQIGIGSQTIGSICAINCPAGTYILFGICFPCSSSPGVQSCDNGGLNPVCLSGYGKSKSNPLNCNACNAGSISKANQCVQCDAGSYSSTSKSSSCQPCLEGHFALAGAISCKSCALTGADTCDKKTGHVISVCSAPNYINKLSACVACSSIAGSTASCDTGSGLNPVCKPNYGISSTDPTCQACVAPKASIGGKNLACATCPTAGGSTYITSVGACVACDSASASSTASCSSPSGSDPICNSGYALSAAGGHCAACNIGPTGLSWIKAGVCSPCITDLKISPRACDASGNLICTFPLTASGPTGGAQTCVCLIGLDGSNWLDSADNSCHPCSSDPLSTKSCGQNGSNPICHFTYGLVLNYQTNEKRCGKCDPGRFGYGGVCSDCPAGTETRSYGSTFCTPCLPGFANTYNSYGTYCTKCTKDINQVAGTVCDPRTGNPSACNSPFVINNSIPGTSCSSCLVTQLPYSGGCCDGAVLDGQCTDNIIGTSHFADNSIGCYPGYNYNYLYIKGVYDLHCEKNSIGMEEGFFGNPRSCSVNYSYEASTDHCILCPGSPGGMAACQTTA